MTYFVKSFIRNATSSMEALCGDDQLLGKRLEGLLTTAKWRKAAAKADLNITVETSEFIADEIWDRMGSNFSKSIS